MSYPILFSGLGWLCFGATSHSAQNISLFRGILSGMFERIGRETGIKPGWVCVRSEP